MTTVAGVFHFGLLAVLSAIGVQRITADAPLLVSLALFAMATLFNPLRNGAQRLVDRLFYRHRADYRRVLQAYCRDLTQSIELIGKPAWPPSSTGMVVSVWDGLICTGALPSPQARPLSATSARLNGSTRRLLEMS
jgi:hypothetical protein